MKKIILFSIFSICTITKPSEKLVTFHCERATLAQLTNNNKNTVKIIGIAPQLAHKTLSASEVRERVFLTSLKHNAQYQLEEAISAAQAENAAHNLIAIAAPADPKQAKL